MKILVLKKERIITTTLPNNVYGDFQIVDIDDNGNQVDLITIKESEGKWLLSNTEDTAIIVNNQRLDRIYLSDYFSCEILYRKSDYSYIMYCLPTFDNTGLYQILDANITIGNNNCDINYFSTYLMEYNVRIYYENAWYIEVLTDTYLVYLNNKSIKKERLYNGDVIFVLGLRIVLLGNYMIINNPMNMCKINYNKLKNITLGSVVPCEEIDEELNLYSEDDYFFRNPRFKRSIKNEVIQIDSPPGNQDPDTGMNLAMTLASSMTMAASSSMSLYTTISNINNGNATYSQAMPTLIITSLTMVTSIIIPIFNSVYQKHKKKQKEKLRQEKYSKYIAEKEKEINDKIEEQEFIIKENNVPNKQCYDIIMNKENNLWERSIEHDDFLNLRVGIGDIEAKVEVNYEKEKFELESDELKKKMQEMAKGDKKSKNVPVTLNLSEKNILAITTDIRIGYSFLETLVLQLMTHHSYEELKIVILTKEENSNYFEYLKLTPFVWNNQKTFRFFATNKDEVNQVSQYLMEEWNNRYYEDRESGQVRNNFNYKNVLPYYVIITDNYKNNRKIEILSKILTSETNMGFSLIAMDNSLRRLPNDSKVFINLSNDTSLMMEPDLTEGIKQEFKADLNNLNMNLLTSKISNVPIEFQSGAFNMPLTYTFLEMFNVGRVEQLNVLARWKESNPVTSLAAPVGIGETGDYLYLDIHEKVHGPHGLIAGMTGSGKSEFIITYILSMAINYSPNEVSFVLIDYKGGGLAGAFENKDTGMKLPHIAGTITNLDKTEIKRSLSSLNSELRRRQQIFNDARDKLGESTIDIYKYQKLYRNKMVDEPLSHLVIVSDEFAELKSQQPEFMDELISTARIGRSLGVHLILATQKPSGVVNDQIWSNSKFKVCLKVQDKSDSMDMLKLPDAASLTNPGSFYLQVGYNEYFYYGQSAWSGAPYYPSDFRIKKIDTAVEFLSPNGQVYKTVDNKKQKVAKSSGEEVTNVVRYLDELAKKENISIAQLWLNRIPEFIKVDALIKKYQFKKDIYVNPVIGEYDDPINQKQGVLTLPISMNGNTIVYGISGSGKELVLTSVVYSSAITYTPDEVNFYILDFAAETMRALSGLPHVGDVILQADKDKLENLFKMLNIFFEKRKELFKENGGSINEYRRLTGKSIPAIVVMINGFDSFGELYPEYVEMLGTLTREYSRFGIYFIITANGTNSVRYKLAQNFKNILALELNDKSDYYSVVGKTDILPSKAVGRGLVKLNGAIHEFQTAYPDKQENSNALFKELATTLKTKYGQSKALSIPVLPNSVTASSFSEEILINKVPIGIYKDSLQNCYFDFKTKFFNKIMSSEIENTTSFTKELLFEINDIKDIKTYLFDPTDEIQAVGRNISRFTSGFDEVMNSLSENVDSFTQHNLVVIYGLDKWKNKVTVDLNTVIPDLYNKFENNNAKISFVVIDSVDNFKKYEYENWYKTVSDPQSALWIGEGISQQFTLKLIKSSDKALQAAINNTFGWLVVNGKHALVKILEFDETNLEKIKNDVEEL